MFADCSWLGFRQSSAIALEVRDLKVRKYFFEGVSKSFKIFQSSFDFNSLNSLNFSGESIEDIVRHKRVRIDYLMSSD